MQWHRFFGAALAVGLLAGAQGAFAQDTPPGSSGQQQDSSARPQGAPERVTVIQEQPSIPPEQQRTLTLTVTEVDRLNNRVYFSAQVDPEAKVQSGTGEQLSINQLNPGDSVRASFDPATGEVQQLIVVNQGAPGEAQQPSPGASGRSEQQPAVPPSSGDSSGSSGY